jgi:hypothetical protein
LYCCTSRNTTSRIAGRVTPERYNCPVKREDAVALLRQFGEMWARNVNNIEDVPGSSKGGQGVYILYDGSTPVYVGKGNIWQRLIAATEVGQTGKRRGQYEGREPQ